MRATNPPSLQTFLNTGAPFKRCNLLTITLQSGTIVRLTDHDVDVTDSVLGAFLHNGPLFKRSNVTHKRGVEVDTMTLDIWPSDTDLLSGVPWLTSIRAGALDFASISVDVGVFALTDFRTLLGTFNWFYGEVADIPQMDTMGAQIQVKSNLARLDILMPRNLVQPGCLNTLFDAGCALKESDWRVARTIASVNVDGSLHTTLGASTANGFYDEGRLVITSGDNTNVVRKVKKQVGVDVYIFAPFVFPLAAGTTMTLSPGCPKTKEACAAKFNNFIPSTTTLRFRGMPFVPVPEAVL